MRLERLNGTSRPKAKIRRFSVIITVNMGFASSVFLLIGLTACKALAQVKGSPTGFAAGTTGGGSATPQYPSSLAE